ncbi:acylphosphatase [Nocardioides pocheonensis]|uniref:Acylphosphatase n=1 Tax=Nocardioides pocheonensis TaxID=661485 RepID=A0A3N0GR12_9ACTN|nr:acylphosphatase [Nocardioides pocheonensis]RNM14923.1 acylphosphatase [Nocardioides pocheonensis]
MSKAVEVRITGLVQGVSFRFHTLQQARALGVAGWVRNEPDGSVTGHFEGSADAVEELVAWCRRGPAYAQVEDVAVSPADSTGATSFTAG